MSNLVPKYDNWSSSTLFSRLVAAYDMILIKCPAPWSLMRLTTVTTPYEACNALLSINHFAKKLSLPVEDALGYVLFREAAKDLRKLLKANQEADVEDSYFVHFRALGLSPKITLLCDCGSLLLQSCASDRSVHGGPPVLSMRWPWWTPQSIKSSSSPAFWGITSLGQGTSVCMSDGMLEQQSRKHNKPIKWWSLTELQSNF